MTWTTEIVKSINQVDAEEWDQLVKERPFADWLWLQLTESVLSEYEPRYVLLRQNGTLQAGAVGFLQTRFQNPLFQSSMGWAVRRFPGLRCGNLFSCDPGLFLRDQGSLIDLFPIVMEGLESLIQQEHISYYTIDHIWTDMPLWQFLQTRGHHQFEHLAEIYLEIQWASFAEYLSSLKSKKRNEYKRTGKRLAEKGISVAVADLQTEDHSVLQGLINNVFQRHREPNLYVEDLLLKANAIMGEDFKLIVARQAGQPIGCIVLLRSGNDWLIKWAGLNYEYTWNTGTYYALLAECVRQSIEAGGRRVRMGATGYQTKRHFTAVRENRIGALAFPNRPIHYLAGKALQILVGLGTSGPIAQAPNRHRK